ncbi:bactofilin family protein [Kineococcus sp. SYSU DK005]|uniref:hypothetical protein n=1 Tax=Kineococcus sp. SYSU DK005 TaxID=3383126 RepID=UPI003D7E093D
MGDECKRSTRERADEGLPRRHWGAIGGVFALALVLAGVLWVYAPMRMIDDEDHTRVVNGQTVPDRTAIAAAENAIRAPLGVAAAALLAGAAAVTGAIVGGHNARLTRRSLERAQESVELARQSNDLARERDRETATHSARVLEHEQARADDDRYAKAIEQLGHAAASVRLGALHSLHRLAVQRPERTETVLDVLCAYLRQPFHHVDLDHEPSTPPSAEDLTGGAWWPRDHEVRDERDAEAEVRRTATRLIPALLPQMTRADGAGEAVPSGAPADTLAGASGHDFDVNLSGAALDELDLSGRRVHDVILRSAYVAGDVTFEGAAHVTGTLSLDEGTRVGGYLTLGDDVRVDGDVLVDGQTRISKGLALGVGSANAATPGPGVRVGGDVLLGSGTSVNGAAVIGARARIGGKLSLGREAYVGALTIEEEACIERGLLLAVDARSNGDVHLGERVWLKRILVSGGVRINGKLWLDADTVVDGDISFNGQVVISEGLVLGPDAHVRGAVSAGRECRMSYLILEEEARIDGALRLSGTTVEHTISLSAGSRIARGLRLNTGTRVKEGLLMGKGAVIEGKVEVQMSWLQGIRMEQGARITALELSVEGSLGERLDLHAPEQIGQVAVHPQADGDSTRFAERGMHVIAWP